MAIVRQTRLTSAKHAAVVIPGAVAVEWKHEAQVAEGMSDGDIGPTSVDIRGWKTSGTLTVDSQDMGAALEDLPNSSAVFGYLTAGGTPKTATFTSVSWGEVSEVDHPAGDSSGPTTRFTVGFEALYGASDTKPANILTIA